MAIALTFILYTGLGLFIATRIKNMKYRDEKKQLYMIILLCIILGLFSAFRGNTGMDTASYRDIYYGENLSQARGFLYLLLGRTLNVLGLPYEVLLFLIGFFTAYFSFKAILSEAERIDLFVAGIVFFFDLFLYSFNVMRQMLAVSICLYAVSLYMKEEKKKAIILFVIAALVHMPAIIYLIIIFLSSMLQRKHYKVIALVCIGGALFLVVNRNALYSVMNYFIGNSSHYMHYFNSAYVGDMEIIPYIVKLSPVVIFCVMVRSYFKYDKQMRVYTVLMIVGYILGALDEFYGNEVGRIAYYFAYLRIYLLAYFANHRIYFGRFCIKQNWEKTIVSLYILIVYIYNIYIAGGGGVVPYGLFV